MTHTLIKMVSPTNVPPSPAATAGPIVRPIAPCPHSLSATPLSHSLTSFRPTTPERNNNNAKKAATPKKKACTQSNRSKNKAAKAHHPEIAESVYRGTANAADAEETSAGMNAVDCVNAASPPASKPDDGFNAAPAATRAVSIGRVTVNVADGVETSARKNVIDHVDAAFTPVATPYDSINALPPPR